MWSLAQDVQAPMCYIGAAASGGSFFAVGIRAYVEAATESGHRRGAVEKSMRDRGEKRLRLSHDIRVEVYKCSACGAESNMSCTVNGDTVCAECFLTICREASPTNKRPARSSIR